MAKLDAGHSVVVRDVRRPFPIVDAPVTLLDGEHFTAEEFRCHDGTAYPDEWIERWIALRDLCDAVRELWGGPLIVVSGYRTSKYNTSLIDNGSHGAASGSYHTTGEAADLKTRRGPADVEHLHRVILNAHRDKQLPMLGGVGDYQESGWVHVDTHRDQDGHLRRWTGR